MKPPAYIDGAKVIKWAWSALQPFGVVSNEDGSESEEIYGLAICQYEGSKDVYRFSCNKIGKLSKTEFIKKLNTR